ncbi:helix-turn-helix transcriptional regulator [Clostridium botulinum]|nr:helix-turn-helix transcriptional regulator [Clostridium botulinum]NFL38959.1 helix-turn-helix transcriptional regulator [Clostridium botulinum]NFL65636.1 helix-turn-helix transcriptional regulator [Clostridium botulinum]NFN08690.1 helix-turn-helix transcriptional regulator [Clostridium botulinum]NFN25136.1 helix-turn-helix transcriptional regulator [Clostridium botulinum]
MNILELGDTIGEKLKYYRLKNNLTQDKLAEIVGFSTGSCIKDIELGSKLPGRETSKKLSTYFNLNTKYFFDTYLEDTDNAYEILKCYRIKHNLSIKKVCNKLNISTTAWFSWESKNNYISRDKYNLLKKYKIL